MEKTYLKNGNSTSRGNNYCMKHFIEVHKRSPNISDKASFRLCKRCQVVGPNEWDYNRK